MNLLEMLVSGQGMGQVGQLARNFGIDEQQAKSAMAQMVPALSQGLKRNMESEEGLASLMQALQRGDHQRYVDQPETLAEAGATSEGNAILGHIFGSKDVSRAVAERAAGGSGLDAGLLKKMLPVVASMVMGGLSKQTGGGGAAGSGGGVVEMLSGFLDADKDGSVVDDLMGMAGKLFR